MNITDYIEWTRTTAVYPKDQAIEYLKRGLISEAGELCGKTKRIIRDGVRDDEGIFKELGDICWYAARIADERHINMPDGLDFALINASGDDIKVAQWCYIVVLQCNGIKGILINSIIMLFRWINLLAEQFSLSLSDILVMNREKLESRKERGTICGSGDNR